MDIYTYKVDDDITVKFTEIKNKDKERYIYPETYEIEIDISEKKSSSYYHVREAGVIIEGIDIKNDVDMIYWNNKGEEGIRLNREDKIDDSSLNSIYEYIGDFIPYARNYIGVSALVLEGIEFFFNNLDKKRGNNVYPRHIKEGQVFVFPIRPVMNNINMSGFSGKHIRRVNFKIPKNNDTVYNNIFIKFRIGQYSGVSTASKEYGIEILENKKNPFLYYQKRGSFFK